MRNELLDHDRYARLSLCSQENKQLLSNYDRWLRQLVDSASGTGVEDLRLTPSSANSGLMPNHLQSSASELLSSRSSRYSPSLMDSPYSDRWRDTLAF